MILQMSKSATGDHPPKTVQFFHSFPRAKFQKKGVYIFVKLSSSKKDMLRNPSFDSRCTAVTSICPTLTSSSSKPLFFLLGDQSRDVTELRREVKRLNVCDTGSLPPLLDQRGHQQVDDPHACQPYDHPERNEPRGGVVRDGSGQGGQDFQEFQGGIGQQEGAVDAMPGLSVRRIRNEADLEGFQTDASVKSRV